MGFGCSPSKNHTIPNNFNLICHWFDTLHSFQAACKFTNIVGSKRDGFKPTTYLFLFPENCKTCTPQMRVCISWTIIKHLKTFKFKTFLFFSSFLGLSPWGLREDFVFPQDFFKNFSSILRWFWSFCTHCEPQTQQGNTHHRGFLSDKKLWDKATHILSFLPTGYIQQNTFPSHCLKEALSHRTFLQKVSLWLFFLVAELITWVLVCEMGQLVSCRQLSYYELNQIPLKLEFNCMCQVVHHTLSSFFTYIQILDFNGDHIRHIKISNLSGLTKNNFVKEALGCKKSILPHNSNGKRTLIITCE